MDSLLNIGIKRYQLVRTQKIRGNNRRLRDVEKWLQENLELRLDVLDQHHYYYTKIIIHPWCDLSKVDSKIPEPKGKIKQQTLNGLLEIYHSWKKELDKASKPYYLKIWLYPSKFSKSQVVCAVDERIDHYENLFTIESQTVANIKNAIKNKGLDDLNWTCALDEYHFDSDDIEGLEGSKWLNRILKKQRRITKLDDTTELYSINQGNIWLGGN